MRDPSLAGAPPAHHIGGAPAANDAGTWLEEHGDYLFSYALSRVHDRHIAEDLVQETLLGAMQSRDGFEHRSTLRTWLTSILRHKLMDHLRRNQRSRASDHLHDEAALEKFADAQFTRNGRWRGKMGRWSGDANDPTARMESAEFRAALIDCLEKLSPLASQAIDLVERSGLRLQELSKILNISPTNAGVVLHRARLAVRRCLELNWFNDA